MKHKISPIFLLGILLLTACSNGVTPVPTQDLSVVYTSAARTVVAELTMTALVFTPTAQATAGVTPAFETPTPLVAETPEDITATPGEEDAKYVADVNYPDGTKLAPGEDFVKTWRIRNSGVSTWGEGYGLVYGGWGATVKMDGAPITLTQTVPPGTEVDISVQFTAPTEPGEYVSYWRMANSQGYAFGEFIYVKIIVE